MPWAVRRHVRNRELRRLWRSNEASSLRFGLRCLGGDNGRLSIEPAPSPAPGKLSDGAGCLEAEPSLPQQSVGYVVAVHLCSVRGFDNGRNAEIIKLIGSGLVGRSSTRASSARAWAIHPEEPQVPPLSEQAEPPAPPERPYPERSTGQTVSAMGGYGARRIATSPNDR